MKKALITGITGQDGLIPVARFVRVVMRGIIWGLN